MRKNILAGFILLMSLSAGIEGQGLDQDCNPIPVPRECERLLIPIKDLDNRIARFQERLKNAGPAMKAQLLRNIEQLTTQREAASAELMRCKHEHGPPPRQSAPSELTARFTGTAALQTSDSEARGPFKVDLDLDFRFSRNRCVVTVTRFPALNLKTDSIEGIGKVAVVVTKTGGGTGTFHPVSGTITIPVTLHFHYDTVLAGDDDATFHLTTGRSVSRRGTFDVTGSPLAADGSITLTGSTRFLHGYLSGEEGSLVIKANISPRP